MRPETFNCSETGNQSLLSISKHYVTTLSVAEMNEREWSTAEMNEREWSTGGMNEREWSTGGMNDTDRAKPKWSKKTLSHCHIVPHKFHVDRWRSLWYV